MANKTNSHRCFSASFTFAVIAAIGFAVCSQAQAQQAAPQSSPEMQRDVPFGLDQLLVPRWRLTDGPHVRSAFREVVREAAKATVRVRSDGKQVALGGIVGADGWVLTKASELRGDVTCQLPDGRVLEAEIAGVSGEFDVALLKLDATNLVELKFASAKPHVGSFVATVGLGRDPEAIGVLSVPPRSIPHQPGVLGVQFEQSNRPLIVKVFPGSGAAQAGLQEQDLVKSINGEPTPTGDKLRTTVRQFNPGDSITIELERDGQPITALAVLSGRFSAFPLSRSQFQNSLGGKLSVRRFGFPSAFQHDTVLAPNQCGGPLVNLDGEVVGFNVARSGRTESYAIESETVADLLFDLRSGKLAPQHPELKASRIIAPETP